MRLGLLARTRGIHLSHCMAHRVGENRIMDGLGSAISLSRASPTCMRYVTNTTLCASNSKQCSHSHAGPRKYTFALPLDSTGL